MKPEEKEVLESKYKNINKRIEKLTRECEEYMLRLNKKEINVLNKTKLTKQELDEYMIDYQEMI